MDLAQKACCVLGLLMIATMTHAQNKATKSGWDQGSSKIKTEHVNIDFGTTSKLETLQNAAQTKQGIRASDTTKQVMLLSDDVEVPVDSIAPFLAVGSRWIIDQAKYDFKSIRIEIRSSADRRQWSEWKKLQKDDHLTVSQDTLVSTLQYMSDTTRFIQFRVYLSGSEDTGKQLLLRSLQLSFTSPGATSGERLQKIKKKKANQQNQRKYRSGQDQDDYPMPEYVTRTGWDCPDGQEPSGTVSRTDVTHQIVHHSAGTNSSSDWPAVVRSIWDYHVNTNGWSDIGYNWLVDPNGIIYQGRGWIDGDDEVQGAHFCGTNSNTMGVCALGNFEEVSPSIDAIASLEELLAWKSDEKNIDPTARSYHASSGLNLFTISGHRDGCSTLCPGENLYVSLPNIRENVNQKIGEPVASEDIMSIEGNYPNPFSGSTTINFSISRPGNVRITIWDVAGRMVDQIADRFYEADRHSESWNAVGYASGIYFCRVEFEDQSAVEKMVFVK